MTEWKNNINQNISDPEFESIGSLFLTGKITIMYKLIEHHPTKVIKLLNMNYKAYHEKLKEPWKFSTLDILVLAYAAKINPEIIFNIIQKEAESAILEKIEKYGAKKKKNKEKALNKKDDK